MNAAWITPIRPARPPPLRYRGAMALITVAAAITAMSGLRYSGGFVLTVPFIHYAKGGRVMWAAPGALNRGQMLSRADDQ